MEHPFRDLAAKIQQAVLKRGQNFGSTEHHMEAAYSEEEPERKALNLKRMEERRKTVLRQRLILAAAAVAAFVLFYVLIAHSYTNRFLPHTYLNGYNVGGMSEAKAEQVLKKAVEKYTLKIDFQDQQTEKLKSSGIGYQYVSSGESGKLLKKQKRMHWLPHLFGKKARYQVKTSFQYDEAKLKNALLSLPEFQDDHVTEPVNAHMKLSDNRMIIIPEKRGNRLDPDVAFSAVNTAVREGDPDVDLYHTDKAYIRPDVTKNDQDLNSQVDNINGFLGTKVVLVLKDGSKRTVARKKLVGWLSKEKDGNYSVDETNIADHCWNMVQAIADKFDDTKNTMEFQTTNLGKKTLPCDPYGYKVDVDEVADRFSQDLLHHKSETIKIKNSVKKKADPTFGGTYIEVDVTDQHVYFYKNGSDIFDTDCVTGLESDPDRLTPSGVFYIYAKDEDKNLEGRLTADGPVTYTSHVSYWMPFHDSYGMHDAPWRDEFGGTIYKDSGSHGCVNLPVDAAGTIFQNAKVGTPVIVVRDSD